MQNDYELYVKEGSKICVLTNRLSEDRVELPVPDGTETSAMIEAGKYLARKGERFKSVELAGETEDGGEIWFLSFTAKD